ncbi:hypothetical protein [Leucobacter ruminantium]|uniref:Uncharacterized protein n=1 Tax=Leucobacter ruminantium TaxID=1289170 RepID=A0A939M1T5_9MICO|nr:hypothetical protein [Leucobacter ruminantium]MBO1806462.1 hypothetical protein [Leucobacter ruminantium]
MTEFVKSIEEWFPKLSTHIQESLLRDPDQQITGETFHAIINARNYGVPIVSWVDVPGSESAHLADDEQDWLTERAKQANADAQTSDDSQA